MEAHKMQLHGIENFKHLHYFHTQANVEENLEKLQDLPDL